MLKNKHNPTGHLATAWQRCRPEDIPRACCAYAPSKSRSERVVSYRLGGNKVSRLLGRVKDHDGFQFVVHLGLRAERLTDVIGNRPGLVLSLQAHNAGADDWQEGCEELKWSQSRFSNLLQGQTASGRNAIPAASAYLFVQSWLELPEAHLAAPFTASSRVAGERVSAYLFSPAESKSILLDLTRSKTRQLDIHLGRGMAVWNHPFSFRPVLEVKQVKSRKGARPENATGLFNEEGDSFYDYASPYPPYPPD